MFFIERFPYGFFSFPVDQKDYFVEVSFDEQENKIIVVFQHNERSWLVDSLDEAKTLLAILEFKEVFSENISLMSDCSSDNYTVTVFDVSMIITDEERNNIIWCLNKLIGRAS